MQMSTYLKKLLATKKKKEMKNFTIAGLHILYSILNVIIYKAFS